MTTCIKTSKNIITPKIISPLRIITNEIKLNNTIEEDLLEIEGKNILNKLNFFLQTEPHGHITINTKVFDNKNNNKQMHTNIENNYKYNNTFQSDNVKTYKSNYTLNKPLKKTNTLINTKTTSIINNNKAKNNQNMMMVLYQNKAIKNTTISNSDNNYTIIT